MLEWEARLIASTCWGILSNLSLLILPAQGPSLGSNCAPWGCPWVPGSVTSMDVCSALHTPATWRKLKLVFPPGDRRVEGDERPF